MNIVTIDFETFYGLAYTLKKLTTAEYIFAPEFETIGVGIKDTDGSETWLEDSDFRVALDNGLRDYLNASVVLAHHAHFDGLILAHHYGVFPAFWLDTLSMSRPVHGTEVGGSLSKLVKHYKLGEKGTEVVQALGKRRRDFTQAEWLQYGEYCKKDCRLTRGLLDKLIVDFPATELALIDLTIRMFTEPVVQLDEDRLAIWHAEEIERKQALLAKLGEDRSIVMSNEKFAVLLQDLGVEVPMKWSEKKKRMDFAFAKKDPEFEALKQHEDATVRAAVEARLGIKSTINETRAARFLSLGKNGRAMPVYLNFAKTHTFRWAGGDKMNWQNLERVDADDPRKGAIRNCVLAPEGHSFVVVDSGAIEARVTAWLAEQEDLVQGFASGMDVYCDFASEAFRREITKKDKKERSAGKVCILGLGYSMSTATLSMNMLKGPMGAPPVKFTREDAASMGVDAHAFQAKNPNFRERIVSILSDEELFWHVAVCDHLVKTYRKKNYKIAQFWWNVCPQLVSAMVEGLEIPLGPIVTGKESIRLPSGLSLRYPQLTQDEAGEASYWNGKHRASLHGGVLTENLVQALARVVVSDQLLEIAGHGYRVVTTTHDEIALCVRDEVAQEAYETLLKIMKTAPSWAPGLPLAAEGGISKRYGDAK